MRDDGSAVVHVETSRMVYLDQDTLHRDTYFKWRDGWTETTPAWTETIPAWVETTHEVTLETVPAWTETIPATDTEPERTVEHPERVIAHPVTIEHAEQIVEHPEVVTVHPPHETVAMLPPPPPPPVERVRESKWQEIKRERDRRKEGGVKVDTKWFHSDTFSRTQWLGSVLMGANLPATMWKTMDNTYVPLTPTLASQVFVALATTDITLHTVAEQKRAAMMALDDPTNYDTMAGWPETYTGA